MKHRSNCSSWILILWEPCFLGEKHPEKTHGNISHVCLKHVFFSHILPKQAAFSNQNPPVTFSFPFFHHRGGFWLPLHPSSPSSGWYPTPPEMSGGKPSMLMCYLCGREFGTRSLPIHVPQWDSTWGSQPGIILGESHGGSFGGVGGRTQNSLENIRIIRCCCLWRWGGLGVGDFVDAIIHINTPPWKKKGDIMYCSLLRPGLEVLSSTNRYSAMSREIRVFCFCASLRWCLKLNGLRSVLIHYRVDVFF